MLKRSSLWASLWLARLLYCMPMIVKAPLPASARVWLDRKLSDLAGFVAHIVFIRAAHLQRPAANMRDRFQVSRANAREAKARYYGQTSCLLSMRAAIGGRLRRVVRLRGSLQQRAETILRALQQQDALLTRFVRRMRRGLSRRCSTFTRVAFGGDVLIPRTPFSGALRGEDTS